MNGNRGQGAVYVFTGPPAGGQMDPGRQAHRHRRRKRSALGSSVAVSGTTIAAGALGATVNGNYDQGAVYVFTEPASGWADETQAAKLTATGGGAFDELGRSVAVSGTTITAGAPYATVNGNYRSGCGVSRSPSSR